MKNFRFAAVLGIACLALAAPALAQSATEVQLPLGDWVKAAGEWVGPLLVATVLMMIRKLPPQIASLLMSMRVEQLLKRAIGYAINATASATADKPLTLDVGNKVVAEALAYAIKHGPLALIEWMGGADAIREKIIARLDIKPAEALK